MILLMLVGGPSQLETWDPKPDAPAEVRGPFRSIATAVPGRADLRAPAPARRGGWTGSTLIRSMHHDAAPIHETGHQLLQTGRLCREGEEHPHWARSWRGCRGPERRCRRSSVCPGPIGNTGVGVSHGQSAGLAGPPTSPSTSRPIPPRPVTTPAAARPRPAVPRRGDRAEPVRASSVGDPPVATGTSAFDLDAERPALRDAYGRNTFGQSCLLARRLVEAGVGVVTVNMFETVFNRVTWDCHGARPFSTLDDYARELLPTFDLAFSALLDDLDRRGLLDSTLVVATGEFGRTPRLNAAGGRDHWPGVWSRAPGRRRHARRSGRSAPATPQAAAPPIGPSPRPSWSPTIYRSLGLDPQPRRSPRTLADGKRVHPTLSDRRDSCRGRAEKTLRASSTMLPRSVEGIA